MNAKELADSLRNVGPKTAEQLLAIGIDTPEKLRETGAEEAYVAMLESGVTCGKPHSAYLYALYGAITDTDWRRIPEDKKQELKKFCQALRVDF